MTIFWVLGFIAVAFLIYLFFALLFECFEAVCVFGGICSFVYLMSVGQTYLGIGLGALMLVELLKDSERAI